MRTLLLIAALASAGLANAECYNRTAMNSKSFAAVEKVADVRYTSSPTTEGQWRCTVSFRAYINGEWHHAEGLAQGSPETPLNQLCARAVQSGNTFLLQSIRSTVVSDSTMVCTDEPKPETHNVNVGDVISESEVEPHQRYRKPFEHKGQYCQWFIQHDEGKLEPWQGVMCRVSSMKWKVIDKF